MPSGHHLPGDRQDADTGHHQSRSGGPRPPSGLEDHAGDHGPAGRRGQGAGLCQEHHRPCGPAPDQGGGQRHDVQGRHHDRDPPCGPDRRRHRQGGGVLLLRHQRPDPDDLRLQPGRRGQVPGQLL